VHRVFPPPPPRFMFLFSSATEVQHDGGAPPQPAGGAVLEPRGGPPAERSPGPDVDGGPDETAAEIHQQALPVLPEHRALQLLHLPDGVRLSPCIHGGCCYPGYDNSPSISLSLPAE